jgi:hypothetical protein
MLMRITLSQPLIISFLLTLLVSSSACHQAQNTIPKQIETSPPVIAKQQTVVKAMTMSTVQAKPEWFSCKQDQDCMGISGVCNSEIAVNRLFRQAFAQYKEAMDRQTSSSCNIPFNPAHTATKVGCVKSRCMVLPQ